MIHWVLAAWCAVTTAAFAAPPPHTLPTEEEWSEVIQGEVVTRPGTDLTPPGAYGWLEIEAPPEKIWRVLNDPQETVRAGGAISSCESYLNESRGGTRRAIGLHYVLSVALTEVSYHILRDFQPDQSFMSWTLDPSRPSDLVSSSGHYILVPGKTPNHTLLVYQSQADSGRRIPQWLQQYLSQKALKRYLNHVRDVAEAS